MKVALIDGNYLMYRAIYKGSHLNLKTTSGIPTAGIFLFLKSLWVAKDLGSPVVVFDGARSTFRTSLYPEYKYKESSRHDDNTEELKSYTVNNLNSVLVALGIPIIKLQEEADDVIYWLAYILKNNGHDVAALSDDQDYIQMINIGVNVYQPMKEKYWNPTMFIEEMKFNSVYYTLWKSLIGDGSDNITGIFRVGDVTATKIIQAFSEERSPMFSNAMELLTDFYQWAHTEPVSKFKTIVKDNFALIKRNLRLIDIFLNKLNDEDLITSYNNSLDNKPDLNKSMELFKLYEFKSLGDWLALIASNGFSYPKIGD